MEFFEKVKAVTEECYWEEEGAYDFDGVAEGVLRLLLEYEEKRGDVREKDYDGWSKLKKQIDRVDKIPRFSEGEIWWCSVGVNIGFEQDGKGEEFLRPFYIARKCNDALFFGIALSSKEKSGRYYYNLGKVDGENESIAILSQARLFSAKRLKYRMAELSRGKQEKLGKRFYEVMIKKLPSPREERERLTPIHKDIVPKAEKNVNRARKEKK